jgi:uncharacterized protein YjbI with pentapeptide repeats
MEQNFTQKNHERIVTFFMMILSVLWIGLLSAPGAIAANPNDMNQAISSKNCYGCDLTEVDLEKLNFKSGYLSFSDFSKSNLSDSSLKSANLTGAVFKESKLERVDLSNANLSDANLEQANLTRAILSNADLTGANLSGANLENARFIGFAGFANFKSANLSQVNLSNAFLNDIDFSGANLSNANLSGNTSLRGANLSNANLNGTDLSNATLSGANLNHANLQGANLFNADFRRVDLTGADLTNANLKGCQLEDAILSDAQGLDSYWDSVLEQANAEAKTGNFLGAIEYIQKIPQQAQSYTVAKTKLSEYQQQQQLKEERQRNNAAAQKIQSADRAASSGNYKRAISILSRVPSNTDVYATAQENIADYERQQQIKERQERDARAKREQKIEQRLARQQADREVEQELEEYAEILKDIDSYQFGKYRNATSYVPVLKTLSRRCDTTPKHIADMSSALTGTLYKRGTKFDNLSFLKQALDATEGGDFQTAGVSCEEVFAGLAILIESGF